MLAYFSASYTFYLEECLELFEFQHLETPSPAPPISRPYSFNTRGTTMDGPKEVIDLALDEDKNVQKWGSVPRSMLGNREEQDVIKCVPSDLLNFCGTHTFLL